VVRRREENNSGMADSSSSHQTLSFLRRRLAEAGIRPRTKLGQNFLIDLNLVEFLARAAELGPDDVVLEVGTGTGSLTALIAPRVAAVVTVEIDQTLSQLAGEHLLEFSNVTLLEADALAGKHRFNPAVARAVYDRLDAGPGRRFKLVANLPYSAATPVIGNLLALDRPPQSMTVTLQKELADRLAASPGAKDYGALSVWVQGQCRVELVRVLPPAVFWPRPQVTSAIVRIDFDPVLRARIADLAFFHQFVRRLFLHRRKFLRSQLAGALGDRADKRAADRILAQAGIVPSCRAEELDVPTMIALCKTAAAEAGH